MGREIGRTVGAREGLASSDPEIALLFLLNDWLFLAKVSSGGGVNHIQARLQKVISRPASVLMRHY